MSTVNNGSIHYFMFLLRRQYGRHAKCVPIYCESRASLCTEVGEPPTRLVCFNDRWNVQANSTTCQDVPWCQFGGENQ